MLVLLCDRRKWKQDEPNGDCRMARRILNRREMRADFDAAESRSKQEGELDENEDTEDEDEDEDEEEGDEGAADDEGDGDDDEGDGDDDEDAPKKKKKKKAKPVVVKAPPKPKRTRTPKIVRQKVVWGVFDNSNRRVATYEYKERKQADNHAAKLTVDKKNTHFVQPVKEPIEEKKEKD
jgi:hypothetical protein